MNEENSPTSLRQKIGLVAFVLFVPVLIDTHWRGHSSLPLVGATSATVVALLAAAGGAFAFWLMAQSRAAQIIGLLTGALAGAGAALAFDFMYGENNLAGRERFFVLLAGAAPGLLLGRFLMKRAEKALKKSVIPAS